MLSRDTTEETAMGEDAKDQDTVRHQSMPGRGFDLLVLCQDARGTGGIVGDPRAVTCEACKATPEYAEILAAADARDAGRIVPLLLVQGDVREVPDTQIPEDLVCMACGQRVAATPGCRLSLPDGPPVHVALTATIPAAGTGGRRVE